MNPRQFFLMFILGSLLACKGQTEPSLNSTNEKIDIESSVDDVAIPSAEYAIYKYDSILQSDILTYHYADLWDIDGDGLKDSIAFVGDGGAHQYFHLEVNLSSETNWIQYEYLRIDMPYISDSLTIIEMDSLYPQFAVFDFDDDGMDEIYINISDPAFHWKIPYELIDKGIFSQRVILDYRDNSLEVEDYFRERQIVNPKWPHWSERTDVSDLELR